ncbi:MAG: hypothetical protein JRI27_10315 [Deltaproteobacteria bacterium]|nr:hypothetical protein [Deltaproteobacteria bacterium]
MQAEIGEVKIYRRLIHIPSTIISTMLHSYSTCPEDRAMWRSNSSAEAGTKIEEGGFCCPLFIKGNQILEIDRGGKIPF